MGEEHIASILLIKGAVSGGHARFVGGYDVGVNPQLVVRVIPLACCYELGMGSVGKRLGVLLTDELGWPAKKTSQDLKQRMFLLLGLR
jgi:hypothetical protein